MLAFFPDSVWAVGSWCQPFKILKSFQSGELVDPWMQRIQTETINSVDPEAQFSWTPNGPGLSTQELLVRLQSGDASLAVVDAVQLAQNFPIFKALEYPGLLTDADGVARIYDGHRYLAHAEETLEAYGVSILAVSHIPFALVSDRYGVETLDDIAGQRIMTGSGFQGTLAAELGAVPVQLSLSRVPLEWSMGTLHGALVPTSVIEPMQLGDLAKSFVASPAYGRNMVLISSDEFMNRAHDEAIIAFEEVAKKTSISYSTNLENVAAEEFAKMEKKGLHVVRFSAYELVGGSSDSSFGVQNDVKLHRYHLIHVRVAS